MNLIQPAKRKWTVRPARSADAPALRRFNAEMARQTEGRELDLRRLARGVQAALRDPRKGVYWVAESGAEVVGQLLLTYEWSDWRNGWFWWIQSVYVDPNYRGRGVFRQLFQRVRALARQEKNVCGLRLYVEGSNQTARAVYERLGLKPTGYRVFEIDFT